MTHSTAPSASHRPDATRPVPCVCQRRALDAPPRYLEFMTIDQARSLVPAHVSMHPVRHSDSLNKREWGYDTESRKAYVIFGAPGKPIALYEYLNVAPGVASAIQKSTNDSQAITDLLVRKKTGDQCTKLYPVSWPNISTR